MSEKIVRNKGGRNRPIEKLSKNPAQIRRRMRRSGKFIQEDIEAYAHARWDGHTIDKWDLEELARGRPRNKRGSFSGPIPKWIGPAIALEAKRRLVQETYGVLSQHIDQAVKVMGQLLVSEEVDPITGRPIVDAKTKFAAAAFIIEHFIGKPKQYVEMEDKTTETKQAIAAAIVLDDGQPQGHLGVIEGEFTEDDEEEDDDDDQ